MKLSKITSTLNLQSVTITTLGKVTAEYFILNGDKQKRYAKHYASLEIDVPVHESDLSLVKHLGYTRYQTWRSVDRTQYANIYNL